MVLAITNSCFRREISTSWTVFGSSVGTVFLFLTLFVWMEVKETALGFNEEVPDIVEDATLEAVVDGSDCRLQVWLTSSWGLPEDITVSGTLEDVTVSMEASEEALAVRPAVVGRKVTDKLDLLEDTDGQTATEEVEGVVDGAEEALEGSGKELSVPAQLWDMKHLFCFVL